MVEVSLDVVDNHISYMHIAGSLEDAHGHLKEEQSDIEIER